MKKVKFTQMKDGTKDDYLLLEKHEKKFIEETPSRILKYMSSLTSTIEGYQVSRLEHSLQSATRALQDKAEDEMIVAALLHDIGDELAFHNHSEFAAAVLKPYVSEKTHWIVEKHGIFQFTTTLIILDITKMKEKIIRDINTTKTQLIFVKIGIKNHLILILNH